MRNCIIAPSVCVRTKIRSPGLVFAGGLSLDVSPSFSFSPHLSLSIDTRSLLFASRHLLARFLSQTSVSSTELAFKPVRRQSKGSTKIAWIIHLSDFTADKKSMNKSALSYCCSPTRIFDLFCRSQKVYTPFSELYISCKK